MTTRTKTPTNRQKIKKLELITTKKDEDEFTYVFIHALICRAIALCYFIAFASLYVQYDGLFGVDGLEPARAHLLRNGESGSISNLLPFYKEVGVDVDTMSDLLTLIGLVSSFLGFVGPNNTITMFISWLCYLSLYKIGQTFLSFQWDILLMEVGILGVCFASVTSFGVNLIPLKDKDERPSAVILNMLRFTLFKLMFMSGIVKIQANCPSWLQLRALEYHYATQCIPTPLAWYFHQIPPGIQQFSVAACLLIEIPCAFLILSPLRFLRLFTGYLQIVLQILILLTGNYNFFNFLTIILALSCFDDQHFIITKSNDEGKKDNGNLFTMSQFDEEGMVAWFSKSLRKINNIRYSNFVFTGITIFITYVSCKSMFSIKKYNDTNILNAYYFKYILSVEETNNLVNDWLPTILQIFSIWVLLISINSIYLSIKNVVTNNNCCYHYKSTFSRLIKMFHTLGVVAIVLLAILPSSIVTFVSISDRTRALMPKYAFDIYHRSRPYMVTSTYGLFRRMTGMGKSKKDPFGREVSTVERPEIIVEGSYDGNSWSEIHFLYKPGKVDIAPPIVAPHQPRLDWQMWFAALGNYQGAPWFIHLVDKLLEGSPSVIGLLDTANYPFKSQPPNFIRSKLYHYDFTRYNYSWHAHFGKAATLIDKNEKLWWHRSKDYQEYTPRLNKQNPSVTEFLNRNGWARPDSRDKDIMNRCGNINVIKNFLYITNKNLCDLTIYVKKKKFAFNTLFSICVTVFMIRLVRKFIGKK